MRYLVLLTLVLFPYAAEAAILINEVAWMGNDVSANDEWIELYNNGGASVSLDGWTLSDGMSLEIKLAGTVGAGQYALLERTDDASAPGTAFLIYTGALTNTGATLTLKRTDGSLEDQVAGGENWENIGGDNTTKETAQLTTSGWVTGAPTPGGTNISRQAVSDDDEESDSTTENTMKFKAATKPAKTVTLELPDADLKLTVEASTLGYVHQPIQFTVEASGVVDAVRESLQYEWNFGDLGTDNGKEPTHVYEYPGTYVVSVRGTYAYHAQVARTEITIVPVAFSLTRNRNGDVQISNDAPYEIDLSGYTLTGTKSVMLPPRTVLLPNSTITVPRERLERNIQSMIALYDTEATMVSSWYPSQLRTRDVMMVGESTGATEVTAVTSVAPAPRITPVAARTSETNSFAFAGEIAPSPVVAYTAPSTTLFIEMERDTGAGLVAAAAATNPAPLRESWPYFALIGLVSVSIVSLYVRKPRDNNQTAQNIVLFDDHD